MKIHKKLMLLVGFGMLVITIVTILSLRYIATAFSRSASAMGEISLETQRIWLIEREMHELSGALQSFVRTGDGAYRQVYERAHAQVTKALNKAANEAQGQKEIDMVVILNSDLEQINKKAERIFSLWSPVGDQAKASGLLEDVSGLHKLIELDIAKYHQVITAQTNIILEKFQRNTVIINFIFVFILLSFLGSIAAFVSYIHRKVSIPLKVLWEGTEEISRGNLDFQMQVHGQGDIARLSERFNEMAQKLRFSYAELEQKLFDRTHELASLDAVALTLTQAGTLKDMLDKSFMRVIDSLGRIDPKGGVFLCEPGGETLRLVVHKGLSPEFVQRESMIKMGECLCGAVAQSGELLFSEQGCEDERHTRQAGSKVHSHIIIPIKSRGIVLGVIFLYPQKDFKLKPSDVQMLDAIGAQLGMAVENFRFYAEVKESSEKYWDLFENATDILFTMDGSGSLTAVNKAAETFSGYSKIELFGKSIFEFLTPDGEATARKMLAGAHGRQWTEFEVVKRDGTKAFVEVSSRRLFSNRKFMGYQVSARDVTEQRHLREILVQGERLGAICQVGVAVRHEINNPLTTVIGNIELLLERYGGKDKELTSRLDKVLGNALRIAEIVKHLQAIKKDKVVEYLKGVEMTDLRQK